MPQAESGAAVPTPSSRGLAAGAVAGIAAAGVACVAAVGAAAVVSRRRAASRAQAALARADMEEGLETGFGQGVELGLREPATGSLPAATRTRSVSELCG